MVSLPKKDDENVAKVAGPWPTRDHQSSPKITFSSWKTVWKMTLLLVGRMEAAERGSVQCIDCCLAGGFP